MLAAAFAVWRARAAWVWQHHRARRRRALRAAVRVGRNVYFAAWATRAALAARTRRQQHAALQREQRALRMAARFLAQRALRTATSSQARTGAALQAFLFDAWSVLSLSAAAARQAAFHRLVYRVLAQQRAQQYAAAVDRAVALQRRHDRAAMRQQRGATS